MLIICFPLVDRAMYLDLEELNVMINCRFVVQYTGALIMVINIPVVERRLYWKRLSLHRYKPSDVQSFRLDVGVVFYVCPSL